MLNERFDLSPFFNLVVNFLSVVILLTWYKTDYRKKLVPFFVG